MSELQQTNIPGFQRETVFPGSIHLLLSGTLEGIGAQYGEISDDAWSWSTGSWHKDNVGNKVSGPRAEFITPSQALSTTGSLVSGSIKGITVSLYPSGSQGSEADSLIEDLKLCNKLRVDVEIGDSIEQLAVDVISKTVEEGYIFYEVDQPLQTPIPSIPIYFKWSGSNYYGYSRHTSSGQDVVISLWPFIPPVESNEYNPTLNNVTGSVISTYARNIESFTQNNVLVGGLTGTVYDGKFAQWSAPYVLRLNGSDANWSSSADYVTRSDAGNVAGPYTLVSQLTEERLTGYACIPDSFFTSITNASGRWLGSKNAEYHIYTGHKQVFTDENLETCRELIQQNVDKGVLLVYEGSPVVFDTEESQQTITLKSLTGSLDGEIRSGRIAGELEGTIVGNAEGYVTNVDASNNRITYYSSSIPTTNHTMLFQNTSGSFKGTGTLSVSGTAVTASGLEGFKGILKTRPLSASLAVSESLILTEAYGNLMTVGTLKGSGSVNFTASYLGTKVDMVSQGQDSQVAVAVVGLDGGSTTNRITPSLNLVYLKNADVQVNVLDIDEGDVQLVGESGSIFISGTLGNNAESLSLHKFGGVIETKAGNYRNIEFDAEDKEAGIAVSVQTADQGEIVLDSFDSYTNVDTGISDINGTAGFVLTNGQINVSSKGKNLHSTLVVEDQVSASTPPDLPGADSFFVTTGAPNPGGESYGVPVRWSYRNVRSVLLGSGSMPSGTALAVGTLSDFTLEGTRRNLQSFEYLIPTGSGHVGRSDTVTVVDMLDGLRAGLATAQAAKIRVENARATAELTPEPVTVALQGNWAYESMMRASEYKVPGEPGTIWPVDSPDFDIYSARDFNLYGANTESLDNYIYQASASISKLERIVSGSVLDFRKLKQGQYAYIYLEGTPLNCMEATLLDFSGSYRDLSVAEDSQDDLLWDTRNQGPLTGSFYRLWGKLGEGTITKRKVSSTSRLDSDGSLMVTYPITYTNAQKVKNQGIAAVVYGAFNYDGLLNGTYEGNLVEGTIEGSMAGNVGGIVETGSIRGGGVRLTGTSRGHFAGKVGEGRLSGDFQDLKINSNQLTETVYVSGSIEGVESIPLEGLIRGQINTLVLPAQCTYSMTASAISSSNIREQMTVHVPEHGTLTGTCGTNFTWAGPVNQVIRLSDANLNGKALGITLQNGDMSGSVQVEETTYGKMWTDGEISTSGQFEVLGPEVSGSVSTGVFLRRANNFSGRISTIPISQSISGQFDLNVSESMYILGGQITGHIDDLDGYVVVQGTVDIAEGSPGNLVEGHDRPFYTVQSFSGSILPEDTTVEAVQNMLQSDMVMSELGLVAGMALLEHSEIPGPFGTSRIIKSQEYVDNLITLPRIGDMIFTDHSGETRVVSSKVYCPDLHALMTVNDRGTVTRAVYLAQIQ